LKYLWQELNFLMRILVTGGYGFIGSNFINNIIDKPEVELVVNVDSQTYAADLNNVQLAEHPKYASYILDINETSKIEQALKFDRITHIVHFAAESHVDNSITGPEAFIKTNINGTFSLLEASKRYGNLQRFHHISTDEVFGSLGDTGFFTETTPYSPRSPYSASKASSDHLVNAYHHTYGMPITMSNCSNNYGPRQHEEKLIPKIIKNIMNGKKVPIYGNGKNIRDWLYVDDHCDAIWDVLTRGKNGESYNIGGDCERNNIQILSTICGLMNVELDNVIEFVEDRKGHDFRYAIDCTKIKTELNWSAKVDFVSGLLKTIEFYSV
jgi:dTDP-glucose 4,6-dehydratase